MRQLRGPAHPGGQKPGPTAPLQIPAHTNVFHHTNYVSIAYIMAHELHALIHTILWLE
jgi:hypothetical protein